MRKMLRWLKKAKRSLMREPGELMAWFSRNHSLNQWERFRRKMAGRVVRMNKKRELWVVKKVRKEKILTKKMKKSKRNKTIKLKKLRAKLRVKKRSKHLVVLEPLVSLKLMKMKMMKRTNKKMGVKREKLSKRKAPPEESLLKILKRFFFTLLKELMEDMVLYYLTKR